MDREISLPFRLDGQGRIATTSDPSARGRQHLTSYLVTRPHERVMRPGFGTPIKDFVFEELDPLRVNLLGRRVQEQVGRDVAGVRMRELQARIDSDSATVHLTVEFALAVGAGEGVDQTTTISLGGGAG